MIDSEAASSLNCYALHDIFLAMSDIHPTNSFKIAEAVKLCNFIHAL